MQPAALQYNEHIDIHMVQYKNIRSNYMCAYIFKMSLKCSASRILYIYIVFQKFSALMRKRRRRADSDTAGVPIEPLVGALVALVGYVWP